MRILAIRGRNLASLEGDFEVRFDAPPLRDVGIFAIAGPTGAGKSTLLDALCLALYDRTPRLDGNSAVRVGRADEAEKDRLGDQDTRALLRRGAGEGRAEVDFVGRDGRRYRATWAVRRARGAVGGRLQGVEVALTDLETGAPLAAGTKTETLAAIEARVGLPFDQFRRSVLLAQGDFAAFLRASAGERADLLESMTGTEIYARLSVAAFRRSNEEGRKVEALELRRGAQQPLADDVLATARAERAAADEALTQVSAALAVARNATTWHADHTRLAAAAAAAAANADAARRAFPQMGGPEPAGAVDVGTAAGLEAAAAAVEALSALDGEVLRARADATKAHASAEQATRDAGTARERACRAATELADLRRRLDAGRAWLAERTALAAVADDWATWRSRLDAAREARARAAGAVVALATLHAETAARAKDVAAAERSRDDARVAVDEAEREADAARRAAASVDAAATRAAHEAAVAAERALAEMDAAARTITARTATVARERAAAEAARADARAHEDRAKAATDDVRLADARLEEARLARERALAARDLAAHRGALVEGEPCPLCGATSHPFAAEAPALDATLAALDARIATLDGERGRAQADAAAETARAREAALRAPEAEARATTADGERAAAQQAWTTARATAGNAAPSSPDDLDAHAAALRTAKPRIDATRRAVSAAEAAQRDVATTVAALATLGKALAAADQAVADLATKTAVCADRIATLDETRQKAERDAEQRLAALADPLAPLGAWRKAFDADPEAFLAARDREVRAFLDRRKTVAADEAGLPGAERLARETAADAKARDEAAAAATRDAAMAAETLTTLERTRAARFGGRATKDVRAALDAARKAHDARQERARDLAAHEAAPRPELGAAEAAALAADLEARRTRLNRRVGELDEQLRADAAVRAGLAVLEAELTAARAGARTWQELSALIGSADGKKLRVFAQSLTLTELVATANAHLAGLRPRYRLARVPDTDLDLQVIDRDLGDEVRSIASLSGGETFLVSLALALGLSSLSAQDVRLDSLFVDEGFGTLDADTLESAIAVLDALQAEGRQVGLISHVPGLAERLGARVEVRPVGVGTSRVRVTTS